MDDQRQQTRQREPDAELVAVRSRGQEMQHAARRMREQAEAMRERVATRAATARRQGR